MSLRIFLLMDPPSGFNPRRDSTMALALEAQARGHMIWYFTPDGLSLKDGEVWAKARRIEFFARDEAFYTEGEPEMLALESAADVVLVRQEPPYDLQYLSTTWVLERLQKPRVLNQPQALRNRPEKLFPLALPQYCPPTLVTRDLQAIRDFRAEQGEIILKPLYSFGGQSIFHIGKADYNLESLLELMLSQSREPVMVQRFLPEVREREVRALLIDGALVGAFNRIPAQGGIRANSRVGGGIGLVELTPKQREICEAVGAIGKSEGFYFIGMDLIGEWLIEVNTTCPTGLQAYRELTGENLAARFWDGLGA